MESIEKIIKYLLVALMVLSCQSHSNELSVQVITSENLKKRIESPSSIQLIDVRTPEEYQKGYIQNAINIDYLAPNFSSTLSPLSKSEPVVLYCKSGNRSRKACEILRKKGFEKIYELEGGVTSWTAKGYELVEGM